MNVKQLETEKNYDDGNDRVWYKITGRNRQSGMYLDGVYGVIDGSIIREDGETIGDSIDDIEAEQVKEALNM